MRIETYKHNGFAIARSFVPIEEVSGLLQAIRPVSHNVPGAGVRSLAKQIPAIHKYAISAKVRALVQQVLGKDAKLVRSVLFSKSLERNWLVTWHQDLSIAVQKRVNVAGYINWSTKGCIPHVQPPLEVLNQMATVRIHLDDADQNNGTLVLAPGTHKLGRIPASEAAGAAARNSEYVCTMKAGDALLFSPLLLHASRRAKTSCPRRVIHLEYSTAILPKPLQWSEAA